MRDDYAKCGPDERVRLKRNVEESERYDPCDSGWYGFPCSDCCKRNGAVREKLEKTDHNRKTCLRRCL